MLFKTVAAILQVPHVPSLDESKFHEPLGSPLSASSPPSHLSPAPLKNSRCTADLTNTAPKNLNEINERKIAIFEGRSVVPTTPANLVGGGRFPGAWTDQRRRQRAAIVDAEIGSPGDALPTLSANGVPSYRVPR